MYVLLLTQIRKKLWSLHGGNTPIVHPKHIAPDPRAVLSHPENCSGTARGTGQRMFTWLLNALESD